ncbi:SEL1-like repeat protein [Thalassovita aquimarina]|uniref:Sel1 repeat family protein n=1 Tax=Thalassovita aquimarina TaxID=2785917 RepID=A0ABS5HSA5_9RHOB|nr:tetratricopeptide repeat protein [Thalassovita aquimarina]MBR9651483.1 sel1 repeat family protein [Thalassovita aquimarina]
MRQFTRIVVLPVLLALPGSLVAQEQEQAADDAQKATESAVADRPSMAEIEQAWQRGDYVFVRQGLKRHAEETGTALAQYRYGRVLIEGKGGPRDATAARDWLEKAVEQNHAEAAVLLGRMYLSAKKNSTNYRPDRAAELFSNAAARGQSEAQYYLALLYLQGVGIEEDQKQAFNWFLAAAEGGHVQAQYELSKAFARGRGTKKNDEEAARWLAEAAAAGHVEAQYFMSVALDTGNGMERNRAAAADWLRRSAEGGLVAAQRALGKKYLIGDYVKADAEEAVRWLTEAAKRGDTQAMFELGQAHLDGGTLPADPGRAWAWFQRASDDEYGPASAAMGRMLEQSTGDAPDLPKAVRFYRKALAQGDDSVALRLGQLAGAGKLDGLAPPHHAVPWAVAAAGQGDKPALDWVKARADEGLRPAQVALAQIYLEANENLEEAAQLLESAAFDGDVTAQYQLGVMLTKGQGVEQDYVQAHKWLNIAGASGHGEAAKFRDVISDLMTAEQIAEAQRAARAYFEEIRAMPPDEVTK